MVWIGTMNLTRTVDRGNFYCPTCGSNQAYRLRHRRPFLTIYFIPVVPVGAAEPFVQCEGCRSHWDPSVLEMTRESHEEAQREQFREEALRAAILVTIADGSITDEEIDALLRVSNNLLQRPLEREELGMQCASAQRLGVPAENYILSVKNRWSEEQCRAALQAAFLAASAGGDLNDQQVKMLARLQEMFHLTDDEYQEIIEDSLMIS
jgi:tellurite resistance protein